MAAPRPDSRGGMDVPLYAPPREPGTKGAPQFVTTTTILEDEFSSVKIHESKGWRRMFPDIPENDGSRGCCGKFKFALWAAIVIALVAGAIGLSIAMVVINDNKTNGSPVVPPGTHSPSNNNKPGKSPSPSPPPSPSPHTDQDGELVIMTNPPFDVPSDWTALWWDEFDGNALDMNYWNYDTGYGKDYGLWAWGNQEQQYYTPENVKVADGFLTVTAQREVTELPDGFKFNYTSARINTKGKAGFYGGMKTADGRQWNTVRIEASVKAPQPSKFFDQFFCVCVCVCVCVFVIFC
jgi:hypothetical protein